jgi:hypothetical protein
MLRYHHAPAGMAAIPGTAGLLPACRSFDPALAAAILAHRLGTPPWRAAPLQAYLRLPNNPYIGERKMAEETREPWLNRMALSTVVLAVCATLSTFKGGGYSTQSVINQALSSDQWAFYQAKSTKQHLYELQ